MTALITLLLGAAIALIAWHHRRRRVQLAAAVRRVRLPEVHSQLLGVSRPIDVYLPPGYDASPERRYPTLYVNDGQDAAALGLRDTLARLYTTETIEPLIVVTIPSNEERLQEYGTAVTASAAGLGRKAWVYTVFVCDELVPLIDEQFRTIAVPSARAFMGASLGGLSAFDITWNRPDVFTAAGVFSGSFWWHCSNDNRHLPPGARIAHEMVRRGPKRDGLRVWLQVGTHDERDDRDGDGVIDAIQDTVDLLDELTVQGYRPGVDCFYCLVPGGRHSYVTWARALPLFLRWVFPRGYIDDVLAVNALNGRPADAARNDPVANGGENDL